MSAEQILKLRSKDAPLVDNFFDVEQVLKSSKESNEIYRYRFCKRWGKDMPCKAFLQFSRRVSDIT